MPKSTYDWSLARLEARANRICPSRQDAGIMPGRHKLGVQRVRVAQQFAEFQMRVAHHARVSVAAGVLVHEIIDDLRKSCSKFRA